MGDTTLSPKGKLKTMMRRQLNLCYYCECEFAYLIRATRPTIEHKQPLSRGGLNSRENRVAACQNCNKLKGPLTESEFWGCYELAWKYIEDTMQPGWSRDRQMAVHRQRLVAEVKKQVRVIAKLMKNGQHKKPGSRARAKALLDYRPGQEPMKVMLEEHVRIQWA